MKKILPLLLLVLLVSMSINVSAQAAVLGSRIAAVQNDQLVVVADFQNETPSITPIMPLQFGQITPVWSPDGSLLAFKNFVADDIELRETIYVTDGVNPPIALVTDQLVSGMPVSWTPDGSQIVYAAYTGPVESREYDIETNATTALVYGIAPQAGAQPQLLGEFRIGEGCGGGSSFPADWRYFTETDLGGTRSILQLTPYGLVHNAVCAGNRLSVTNLETGETTLIGRENVQHALVSPDGTQVAGTENGKVVVYDLPTGTLTEYETNGAPDQIAWGPDLQIYYSIRTLTGNLTAGFDEATLATMTQFLGTNEVPDYRVEIYTVGGAAPVFSGDFYAVGRMAVLPDNSGMVISVVDNMDAWVNGIADGTFDFSDEADFDAQFAAVQTRLLFIPFSGGEVVSHVGLAQFALNNGW